MRAGIRAALREINDSVLVGECDNVAEAERLLKTLQPDLLILDILLGHVCSLESIEKWSQLAPGMRILVVSAWSRGPWLALLNHPSVAGFLSKRESPHHLLQAVRVIRTGGRFFSQRDVRRASGVRLSAREQKVLGLMRRALPNLEIARQLGISIYSVRRCITAIYLKLGVKDRLEAILQVPQN